MEDGKKVDRRRLAIAPIFHFCGLFMMCWLWYVFSADSADFSAECDWASVWIKNFGSYYCLTSLIRLLALTSGNPTMMLPEVCLRVWGLVAWVWGLVILFDESSEEACGGAIYQDLILCEIYWPFTVAVDVIVILAGAKQDEAPRRLGSLLPGDPQGPLITCVGLLGRRSDLPTREVTTSSDEETGTAEIPAALDPEPRKNTATTADSSGNSDDENTLMRSSKSPLASSWGKDSCAARSPGGRRRRPEFCSRWRRQRSGSMRSLARCADESDGSDSESELLSPQIKLPPPLDFLPTKVSLEQLQTFRVDYQKFRAGKATGAKGEVTNTRPQAPYWASGSLSEA